MPWPRDMIDSATARSRRPGAARPRQTARERGRGRDGRTGHRRFRIDGRNARDGDALGRRFARERPPGSQGGARGPQRSPAPRERPDLSPPATARPGGDRRGDRGSAERRERAAARGDLPARRARRPSPSRGRTRLHRGGARSRRPAPARGERERPGRSGAADRLARRGSRRGARGASGRGRARPAPRRVRALHPARARGAASRDAERHLSRGTAAPARGGRDVRRCRARGLARGRERGTQERARGTGVPGRAHRPPEPRRVPPALRCAGRDGRRRPGGARPPRP